MKRSKYYLFVIDTEQFVGDFDREMTAYVTGRVSSDGIASKEAQLFYKETNLWTGDWNNSSLDVKSCYSKLNNPFGFVMLQTDNDGVRNPSEMYSTQGWVSVDGQYVKEAEANGLMRGTAFLSLAIYMERTPTEHEESLLVERSHKFTDYWKSKIDIAGFRLIEKTISEETIQHWHGAKIQKKVKTVGWLKAKLRGLPDHLPVHMDVEDRKFPLIALHMNDPDDFVTLTSSKLEVDIKKIYEEQGKIPAIRAYRELVEGASLKSARIDVYRMLGLEIPKPKPDVIVSKEDKVFIEFD